MERCNWDTLCKQAAVLMPVISLPTYRTVGMHKPVLVTELVNDPVHMAAMQLDRATTIRQYETMMDDYALNSGNIVKTDKPTYLIGYGLCKAHADRFKLSDWFAESEWRTMMEMGREKGFIVPEPRLIVIEFKPMGWEPRAEYMEVER